MLDWISIMNNYENSKKSNEHLIEYLMKQEKLNSCKMIQEFNIDKKYGRCKLNKNWLRFTLGYGGM